MRLFKPEHVPPLPQNLQGWPFPCENPTREHLVDLEIGAGAGLHAIRYGQQNPDRFLIALERTSKADRFQRRLKNHPMITNVLGLRVDAIPWITHNVPSQSLSRVFLLYPNPYPKSGHKNLRWHHMPFTQFLISRLKPGGEITLATNERFYFDEAVVSFQKIWGLQLKSREQLHRESPARTHFEKKYLQRGLPCWNLIFQKPAVSN